MTSLRTLLACLLLAGVAAAQANAGPELKPRPNSQVEDLPMSDDSTKVAPDAAVITINGVCDKAPAQPGGDCKTVVTREEFEKLANSVKPNMPKPSQKQFASRYVLVLTLANKAHEQGLDHGPEFDEQMYLARVQLLARMAGDQIQKEAARVSEDEISGYYQQHAADFKTITYEKIYVPRQKQMSGKADEPDYQKKVEATQAEMKELANKLRARAAAGEDFTKLQQEAYDAAGMKLSANNATVRADKVRKQNVPPADASIFDLKKGTVSQVFDDPQGFMIYKPQEIQDLPLATVHDEVSRAIQSQRIQTASQELQKSVGANTVYNDAFFATPAPPTLRNPGEKPASAPPPAPGNK